MAAVIHARSEHGDSTARLPRNPALEAALAARDDARRDPAWESLRRRIYTRAIRFSDHLAFDFREMLTDAATLETAAHLLWRLLRPFDPSVVVGPGYGSAPLLSAIALAARSDGVNLSVLMVRDTRKKHHMKKWVEGRRQPAGSRAVIVDDFMLEGSAVPLVEKALRADRHELDIAAVVLFFDMWQPLGSRQLSVSHLPVVSLFRRHDIGLSRDCFDARPPAMKGSWPGFIERRVWWRFDLNKKAEYPWKSSPVVADGAVFAADDHCNVWRHSLADGAIEWKYESLADPPKGIVQLLQYADGSLVFGCYDGTVTRLDGRSGRVIWRVRQDSSIHATPAIDAARGRVFINTEQWNGGAPLGSVIALDWANGRLLWQHRHRYWAPGSPFFAAREEAVVASCNDRSLVCVDAGTGEQRWKFRTHGLVRGRPVVAEGRAYAATETGRLHSVVAATGEEAWTIRYGAGLKHAFLVAHEGCIYLYDYKWHLSAFDALSGELRWISRLRSQGSWCPVPCGEYLVALSREGHLAVLDPRTELKIWEDSIGGTYRQPPAIADGYLAAASNDQGLKVFKLNPHYVH